MMACTVTESFRTVILQQVEAGEVQERSPSYPYPPLVLLAETCEKSIPVLVLENDHVVALIAPTLGGRLLTLDSKSDIIAESRPLNVPLTSGGRRGVLSPFGLQLTLDGQERLDALGQVDTTCQVSEDERTAEVTIGSIGNWPLSFHLTYLIEEDSSAVFLETKVFNRSLQPCLYNAGLLLSEEKLAIGSKSLGSPILHEGGRTRFGNRKVIAPHQLDTWTATLFLLPEDATLLAAGEGIVVTADVRGLQFHASRSLGSVKVVLLNALGETLEATLTVSPTEPISIPLLPEYLPLKGLVVLDSQREELLRWPEEHSPEAEDETVPLVPSMEDSTLQIRDAGFQMGTRHLSHYLMGLRYLAEDKPEESDFEFEQSLLFNGEDHLAWWLKGLSARSLESQSSDGSEILNAHYLAPLEPALRVEAFLAQDSEPGPELNPILAPLLENPDAILDVAGILVEAGLFKEAAKLVSEILRSKDFPMLRYVLAYCFLKGTKMTIEASEQVKLAESAGTIAPYPVRPIEKKILTFLFEKWPNNPTLAKYQSLSI